MYSGGLEYIVRGNHLHASYSQINYFSKNADDNYGFKGDNPIIFERQYAVNPAKQIRYKNQIEYSAQQYISHTFVPEIFLNPSRPKTRFVDDIDEIKDIANETFELMMKEKIPSNISISILPFDEFKALHSVFGLWSEGILGFSINGDTKKIFVRENNIDA